MKAHHLIVIASVLMAFISWSGQSNAATTEETTCKDIGFKPKTASFRHCVTELVTRSGGVEPVQTTEEAASLLSPNQQECVRRGIKQGTVAFSRCVRGLDIGSTEQLPIAKVSAPALSPNQQACADRGLRPKTTSFRRCVTQLDADDASAAKEAAAQQAIANLPPNQRTCVGYGFKSGTQPFAQCLLQLDQMKQQAEIQQQQYQYRQQLYQQQQAAYEAQAQAAEKERQNRKWEALARLGFGMAASNSPTFAGGVSDGLSAASGMPVSRPMPPSPPPVQTYTIRTASGNQVYCTYNTAAALVTCN